MTIHRELMKISKGRTFITTDMVKEAEDEFNKTCLTDLERRYFNFSKGLLPQQQYFRQNQIQAMQNQYQHQGLAAFGTNYYEFFLGQVIGNVLGSVYGRCRCCGR